MSIMSITTDVAGQVGVNPRRVKIVTTDNLSTITTAGYLSGAKVQGFTFYPTDVFDIIYSYNQASNSGTFDVFTCSISSGGIVTLALDVDAGNVLLPVVSGNVASYNGTSGQIKDSGLAPSSTTSQLYVVTSPGSLTSGNIAKFNDTHGTVADSSIAATNVMVLNSVNTLAAAGSIVANKVNGTEAANAVTASGMSGVITTSSLTTAAGANYAITWTNTFISATSSVLLSIQGGTNTVLDVQFKVVPGAGSATLTIYNVGPTAALNGTILIGYLVI